MSNPHRPPSAWLTQLQRAKVSPRSTHSKQLLRHHACARIPCLRTTDGAPAVAALPARTQTENSNSVKPKITIQDVVERANGELRACSSSSSTCMQHPQHVHAASAHVRDAHAQHPLSLHVLSACPLAPLPPAAALCCTLPHIRIRHATAMRAPLARPPPAGADADAHATATLLVPTSPRSVDACLRLGFDPLELAAKPLAAFARPGESEELTKLRHEHHEQLRQVRCAGACGYRSCALVLQQQRGRRTAMVAHAACVVHACKVCARASYAHRAARNPACCLLPAASRPAGAHQGAG